MSRGQQTNHGHCSRFSSKSCRNGGRRFPLLVFRPREIIGINAVHNKYTNYHNENTMLGMGSLCEKPKQVRLEVLETVKSREEIDVDHGIFARLRIRDEVVSV